MTFISFVLSSLASPTLSIPQQWVVLERESKLECHAEGFYPPPISFSWTRDGSVIRPPLLVEAEQTPNGYYQAVGNLTFYPSQLDQNVTFGCEVTHAGVQQVLGFQLNITCKFQDVQLEITFLAVWLSLWHVHTTVVVISQEILKCLLKLLLIC